MEIELAEFWPHAVAVIGFLATVIVGLLIYLYQEDRRRIRRLEEGKADTDDVRDLRKMIGARLGRIEGHLMRISEGGRH